MNPPIKKSSMNQYHKFMEKFWLIIAIATFIYAVYMIGKYGLAEQGILLIMPAIAAALFYLRYFTRKRFGQDKDRE